MSPHKWKGTREYNGGMSQIGDQISMICNLSKEVSGWRHRIRIILGKTTAVLMVFPYLTLCRFHFQNIFGQKEIHSHHAWLRGFYQLENIRKNAYLTMYWYVKAIGTVLTFKGKYSLHNHLLPFPLQSGLKCNGITKAWVYQK